MKNDLDGQQDADELALQTLAARKDVPLAAKARALRDTLFVRYGTTVASVGEWALLLAVIEGVQLSAVVGNCTILHQICPNPLVSIAAWCPGEV